jgi:hypothetical protein
MGFNSVKNNVVGNTISSRQLLNDEIAELQETITLQASNSKGTVTMNEDIPMADVGLDAYKLGLDSSISDEKNSVDMKMTS